MIKPQYRNMAGPGAPFGAEVSPAPGADDWERLAAFTGRDPGQRSVGKGRARRCAAARDRGLLSVTGYPTASVSCRQSSRLPTDHVSVAKTL